MSLFAALAAENAALKKTHPAANIANPANYTPASNEDSQISEISNGARLHGQREFKKTHPAAAVATLATQGPFNREVSQKSRELQGGTLPAANDPPPVVVVRKRFTDACTALHLDARAVGRQFDAWRYTAVDLAEMQGWPDSTVQAHARLLVRELEQGIQP